MPERTLQGQRNGGRVVASRERVDGTPSRKEKGRESLAVQDPGLKDYVCFLSLLCLVTPWLPSLCAAVPLCRCAFPRWALANLFCV